MRAPSFLAACACAALLTATAASTPSPSPSDAPLVSNATGLHAALLARDAATVRVGGADGKPAFITINASSWTSPVVLEKGRAIVLESADPASPSTLQFSTHDEPSLVLTTGASLVLRALIVRGLGPVPEPGAGYRLPHVPSLPFGKGDVAIYPGSSVALVNVTAYMATASCDALAADGAIGAPVGGGGGGGGGGGSGAPAPRPDPVQAIPRLGDTTRDADVVGGVNETKLGVATVREAFSLYLCAPGRPSGRWPLPYPGRPPADAGGADASAGSPPSVPPGAVVGAALGGAAAALAVAGGAACVGVALARRRRKRRGGGGGDVESVDPPSSAAPPPLASPAKQPALLAVRRLPSTAKQSSDDPPSSLTLADRRSDDVPSRPPSPPSPAAATGVPSAASLDDAATFSPARALAPPVTTPEGAWLRRRIGPADAPDDLDVGPLIGRGSFGAVYKARWFGGLCALKVVLLSPDAAAAAVAGAGDAAATASMTPVSAAVGVRVGRELSLGVALSHPHLVATYRAWIVDAGEVGARRASWEGPAASAWTTPPPSNPDRAVSLDRADSGLLGEVEAAAEGGGAAAARAALAVAVPPAAPPASLPSPSPREAWILMELCSLGTLDAAVRARRFAPAGSPAALAAALRTLRDVAAGMEYLHAHAVVHGDLKACNVLLKPAPRTPADARGFVAKVADFGLARFVGPRGHVSTRTHGSVQYMAPEVLASRRVGLPADVFSFGVLAAEVLTGRKPHAGRTVGAVVHAVVASRERPSVPPDAAPAAVRALVHACWAEAEADRPAFGAILAALRAFCEGDWTAGDAAWRGGGAAGDSDAGVVARVVPAVLVEAARVASGGSVRGGGASLAVTSPGKGRVATGAWEE